MTNNTISLSEEQKKQLILGVFFEEKKIILILHNCVIQRGCEHLQGW